MDEFVAHAGVMTTHGYTYFVGSNGNVRRVVARRESVTDISIEEYENCAVVRNIVDKIKAKEE